MLANPNNLRLVKTAANPSLAYGVMSGAFSYGPDIVTYAGGSDTLTDDATNYVYLTPAGVLTGNTTDWPTTPHVRIATVLTADGAYDFTDITDCRSACMWQTVVNPGMKVLTSQSLAFGDFTDNGDATGYIDFTSGTIPVSAIVLGWEAVVSTGFTGDTTAVIEVGVSGDTDAFSADTAQSVLAAATVGSASLAAESYIGSAATPRVTVTGGADFGSISAGTMVVTVFYMELK